MLSNAQIKDVCLFPANNTYKQCRYLKIDPNNYKICNCVKNTPLKKEIDKDTEKYINDCIYLNIDPRSQGYPIGDNCDGFLSLKDVMQGYDIE